MDRWRWWRRLVSAACAPRKPTTGTRSDAGEEERRIQLAQADESRYRINLDEEEGVGHTLRLHIAKNDAEVRELLAARTLNLPMHRLLAAVESAFDSERFRD